jgi:WD40 repeat protein
MKTKTLERPKFIEILELFVSSSNKTLLLLGSAGSGKTILLKQFYKKFLMRKFQVYYLDLKKTENIETQMIQEICKKYQVDKKNFYLKEKKSILILDHYGLANLHQNLYATNKLENTNCQVIFACRDLSLINFDYKTLFSPFIGNQRATHLLDILKLTPLTLDEAKTHINQCQKVDFTLKHVTILNHLIEKVPGFTKLVTHPYLLYLIIKNLPKFITDDGKSSLELKQLASTVELLMNSLIQHWYQRELTRANMPITKKTELINYAIEVAEQITKTEKDFLTVKRPSKLFKSEPNQHTLFDQKSNICIARLACPIVYTDNHIQFISPIFLNTFNNFTKNKTAIKHQKTKIPKKLKQSEELNNHPELQPLINHPLNHKLITKNNQLLQFLSDKVLTNTTFKNFLFSLISASKKTDKISIAAANAITILNFSGIIFSRLNFRHIKIPNAVLDHAILEHCDLSDADLNNVSLRQAYLKNTLLTNSNVANIDLNEYPIINGSEKTRLLDFNETEKFIVSVHGDGNINVWDITTWDRITTLSARNNYRNRSKITIMHCIPNGKDIITIDDSNDIKRWNIENKIHNTFPKAHANEITCSDIDTQGKFLLTANKNIIFIWSLANNQIIEKLTLDDSKEIMDINIHPNNKHFGLVFEDENSIEIWDISKKSCIKRLAPTTESNFSVIMFNKDGRFMATGNDEKIYIWNTKNWQLIKILPPQQDFIEDICFLEDGANLIYLSDKAIWHWNFQRNYPPKKLEIANSKIKHFCLLQKEQLIISGSKSHIAITDINKTNTKASATIIPYLSPEKIAYSENTQLIACSRHQ